ncbi:hypothetical protein BGZ76_003910, partial [Entomortierella beljakovae]
LALEYTPEESEKAQEHIHKATTVLKARIEKLNGLLSSGKGKARATDANESETKMAKELIELHELVEEMNQKHDSELLKGIISQPTAQPVNDISNLIKPKYNKAAPIASASAPSTSETPSTSLSTEGGGEESSLKRKADEGADEDAKAEETDKKIKV